LQARHHRGLTSLAIIYSAVAVVVPDTQSTVTHRVLVVQVVAALVRQPFPARMEPPILEVAVVARMMLAALIKVVMAAAES
jgi:hypothetical protein